MIKFYAPKKEHDQVLKQGEHAQIACQSGTYTCGSNNHYFLTPNGIVFREVTICHIKDGEYALVVNISTPNSECPKVPRNAVDMDTMREESLNSSKEILLPSKYIWPVL